MPSKTMGTAARESSDIFWRVAGTGALEREQQEAFGAAATLGMFSSIFIWSQPDFVCGVAHSAILEEKMAQADRGSDPNPAILNANAKMRDRRTIPQCNIRPFAPQVSPRTQWKTVTFITLRCKSNHGWIPREA